LNFQTLKSENGLIVFLAFHLARGGQNAGMAYWPGVSIAGMLDTTYQNFDTLPRCVIERLACTKVGD